MSKYIIGLLSLTLSIGAGATDIEFPSDSDVSIVAKDIYMNGNQISIWQVKNSLTKKEHANFYAENWKGNGKNFGVKNLKSETVVSKLRDQNLMTAQVMQSYPNSVALVSISHKPTNAMARIVNKIADIPKPSGSKVFNEIKAKDGAKYSATLVLSNKRSIASNISFYIRYIKNQGFTIDRVEEYKKKREGVILARRGPNEFNATFHKKNNQTFITAIRVDADI